MEAVMFVMVVANNKQLNHHKHQEHLVVQQQLLAYQKLHRKHHRVHRISQQTAMGMMI